MDGISRQMEEVHNSLMSLLEERCSSVIRLRTNSFEFLQSQVSYYMKTSLLVTTVVSVLSEKTDFRF